MKTKKYVNPFFVSTDIPDEYFCDRDAETAKIIGHIRNGSNIVLKAPRRLGKSSLIKHVFAQKEIVKDYNTLYVDIYATKNALDFQLELQGRLLNAPFAKGTRLKMEFESLLKGAYFKMGGINAVSGQIELPGFGFAPSSVPILSLEAMFDFLSKTKKQNLVVFDEFQQIEAYPERMAATLRSFVQGSNNTRFIFSGSSRHMLATMFQLSNQPFYKSAVSMDLDVIPVDTYTAFCERMFESGKKKIDPEAVEFVYYLFSGETYLMQALMKDVYASLQEGASAGIQEVKDALFALLESRDSDYKDILNRLNNKKERNTLFCIALEGIGKDLTSSYIMNKYALDSASSVQNALNNLGDDKMGLITKLQKGTYVIQDRLFELWLAFRFGRIDQKFESAPERFVEQREIERFIAAVRQDLL